jgi:hypothetical protein
MLACTSDDDDEHQHQVTMVARAPNAGRNLYRLFHVLWRCVNEMEKILATIPGVLLDRCVRVNSGVHSRTGQHKKVYRVAFSGIDLDYDVDNVSQLKKALEKAPSMDIQTGRVLLYNIAIVSDDGWFHALCSVRSSVSEDVPLRDVFSCECADPLTEEVLRHVSRDVNQKWRTLADELGMNSDEIPQQDPYWQCVRMLENWVDAVGNATTCTLYDALYACGLQSVADQHFGHILDTVLRKQHPGEQRLTYNVCAQA